jgi:RNA polymerase sigma factor (sigma-70 family)
MDDNMEAQQAIEECFRRRGDDSSIMRFERAMMGVIRTYMMTICRGDWDLVNDVCQEVRLKCIEMFRAGKPAGREYQPAYFVAMARNRFVDEMRRRKRIVSCDDLYAEMIPGSSGGAPGSEEDRIALHMALLDLGEADRYVIEKRFFEGWSDMKIASFLPRNPNPSTIPMKLLRARRKLKKIMSGG